MCITIFVIHSIFIFVNEQQPVVVALVARCCCHLCSLLPTHTLHTVHSHLPNSSSTLFPIHYHAKSWTTTTQDTDPFGRQRCRTKRTHLGRRDEGSKVSCGEWNLSAVYTSAKSRIRSSIVPLHTLTDTALVRSFVLHYQFRSVADASSQK